MARFVDFARAVKQVNFHPSGVEGKMVADELAGFARQQVRRVIETGEASAVYDLYVNGHAAASENEVEVPGPILYVFSYWTEIIEGALAELIKRSPRQSGRFASSFVVLVNGRQVTPGADISSSAEVIITNVQPYVRRIQTGNMQTIGRRMFDKTRRTMVRKFGGTSKGFHFQVKFLDLAAGIHPMVPYVLKGGHAQQRQSYLARVARGTARRGERKKLYRRKALEKGQHLTYPALVMNLAH